MTTCDDNTPINVIINETHSNEADIFSINATDNQSNVEIPYSTRMSQIDDEYNLDKISRHSVLQLAPKSYPRFHHYSFTNRHNLVKFPQRFTVLPSIRGENIIDRPYHEMDLMGQHNNTGYVHNLETIRDLRNVILNYGGLKDEAYMKFVSPRHGGKKLVRPGFSARRYMSNLVKQFNSEVVKNLIEKGHLLEKSLYTTSTLVPNLRQRINDDLSGYPEPYRILRQMLISPGPLNEFSFLWRIRQKDMEKELSIEMGEIKILTRKKSELPNQDQNQDDDDFKSEYEEVNYELLPREKKKKVISNLLVKSAVNHALKVKDQYVQYNRQLEKAKRSGKSTHEIHIPFTKFDMMEAVTEMLSAETEQTINKTTAPFHREFKGKAFKGGIRDTNNKQSHDATKVNTENETTVTNDMTIEKKQHVIVELPKLEDNATSESHFIPNLSLKLNKKKSAQPPVSRKHHHQHGVDQKLADSTKAVMFDSDALGSKETDPTSHGELFAENLKRKAEEKQKKKQAETRTPYGIYKDEDEYLSDEDRSQIATGDIDPTISFHNWRYSDKSRVGSETSRIRSMTSSEYTQSHHRDSLLSLMSSMAPPASLYTGKQDSSNVPPNVPPYPDPTQLSPEDQKRLVDLLGDHANVVADTVLSQDNGGKDFAIDINEAVKRWNIILKEKYFELFSYVAIKEVMLQAQRNNPNSNSSPLNADSNPQVWNLDVDNPQAPEQYEGMIKNIFKSIFKDQLEGDNNSDIEMSPEVMKVLQSGSKLSLDQILIKIDERTGQKIVTVKQQNSPDLVSPQRVTTATVSSVDSPIKQHDGGHISVASKHSSKDPSYPSDAFNSQSSPSEQNLSFKSESRNQASNQNEHGFYQISESDIAQNTKQEGVSPVYRTGSKNSDLKHKNSDESVKKQFKISKVDESTEVKRLYSKPDLKKDATKVTSKKPAGAPKKKVKTTNKPSTSKNQPKSTTKKITKIKIVEQITATEQFEEQKDGIVHVSAKSGETVQSSELIEEREDSGDIRIIREFSSSIDASDKLSIGDHAYEDGFSGIDDDIGDISEEALDDGNEEDKERRLLLRKQREAKRKAEAEKRKLDVERRRREKDEARKDEIRKRELEESLKKKMEEDRLKIENQLRDKHDREVKERLEKEEAEKREKYMEEKRIERERREREEYMKKLEEARAKKALEDQRRKEEQERLEAEEAERIRLENEMISRMKEEERIEYLRKKAEEEERKRQEEEEKRLQREEEARIALEEARKLAQQQARERALLEARLRFVRGLRIESEGLKKYLNVTPAFVWSYFEFLKVLGLKPSPEFGVPTSIIQRNE